MYLTTPSLQRSGRLGLVVAVLGLLAGCGKPAPPSPELVLENLVVEATRRQPGHAARWDAVIRDLAHRYVNDIARNRTDSQRGIVAHEAIAAGCTDPFVRYIWYAHQANNHYLSDRPEFAQSIRAIVDDLQAGEYPAFLRAYAENRAYLLWYFHQDKNSPVTNRFSQQNWQDVFATLNDPATPEWLARALSRDIADLWSRHAMRQELSDRLEAALKVHYGDCAGIPLLHAQNALDLVRRQAYDHETIPEADKNPGGLTDIAYAEAELKRAWAIDPRDPRIPGFMIEVCVFRKLPREQMELWFQRAVATGRPANGASLMKFTYLSPEWFGSLEDQLQFARSTLQHPEYGQDSPLLAERAHRRHAEAHGLGDGYFGRPEVWADIRPAYLAYLENYPYDLQARLAFARYAWLARDWATLNEQLDQIDPTLVNVNRVGGQHIFDRMVEEAGAHRATPVGPDTSQPKPDAPKSF